MVAVRTGDLPVVASADATTHAVVTHQGSTAQVATANINTGGEENTNVTDYGVRTAGAANNAVTINPATSYVHRLQVEGTGDIEITIQPPAVGRFQTFLLRVRKNPVNAPVQLAFLTNVAFPNGAVPNLGDNEWHIFSFIGSNHATDGVIWEASTPHRH